MYTPDQELDNAEDRRNALECDGAEADAARLEAEGWEDYYGWLEQRKTETERAAEEAALELWMEQTRTA